MSEIRKTERRDTESLMSIFAEARQTIAALGIDQWQNGYPNPEIILEDIEKERSYLIEIEGDIVGTFALIDDGEPTYDQIFEGRWLTDDSPNYLAIHRVAVAVKARGTGVSSCILDYAKAHAIKKGQASLRIDTHEGNVVMRRMLEKNGFSYCGVIYLESGESRMAYEKVV